MEYFRYIFWYRCVNASKFIILVQHETTVVRSFSVYSKSKVYSHRVTEIFIIQYRLILNAKIIDIETELYWVFIILLNANILSDWSIAIRLEKVFEVLISQYYSLFKS